MTLKYFAGQTMIPGPCPEHADCKEWSVIPSDPTQSRFIVHSPKADVPTDGPKFEDLGPESVTGDERRNIEHS